MSLTAFQAVLTLNSVAESAPGSGIWTFDATIVDNEGIYSGYDVNVNDVIVLDTAGIDVGTLSRYTITSVVSKSAFGAVVVAEFDASNNTTSPDLQNYDLLVPGLVTRKTTNYKLLNLPSLQVQGLSDKFAFYLINYMSNDIVDNITGGGGGDIIQVLTNATPTPTTIGGIAAGTTFNNIPVETILQNLLYPYQVPSFSAFAISGQTTPLEVGASVTGGSHTFTWSTANSTNINANSVTILDTTSSLTLATGLANTGTQAIVLSSVTPVTATTHNWRISAVSTQSSVFTKDYAVTWQWKRFYGESTATALIASAVQALRIGGLSAAFAGTYAFVAGGYKYIAYPSSFGTATSFKDQSTNLDVPFQVVQVLSITNTNGIAANYNVHRTTNIIGSAMTIVVA